MQRSGEAMNKARNTIHRNVTIGPEPLYLRGFPEGAAWNIAFIAASNAVPGETACLAGSECWAGLVGAVSPQRPVAALRI